MSAFESLLAALETGGNHVTGTGRQRMARCPSHDDGHASLSLAQGNDRVLLKCQAGCDTDDVLAALNLTRADLFDTPKANGNGRQIVATYDYTDEAGTLLYQGVRYEPKDFIQRRPDGHGGWIYKLGDTRRVLYRLPAVLAAAKAHQTVYVVEGEKDCHSVEKAGAVATCNVGGAGNGKWKHSYTEALIGAEVVIIPDLDIPGRAHAGHIAKALRAAGISTRLFEPASGKDVSDHITAGLTLADLVAEGTELPSGEPPPDTEQTKSPRRSWQRVDLTDVLAGRYIRPTPTVGARTDGPGLFYPGRLHTIASESEGGKTWLALATARCELDAGNAVVYLDFEDDEGGVVGRLMALGTDRESIRDRFAYIRPDESFRALGNREDLEQVLFDLHPTLAVLDGVTEAMTLHNLEMKDNTEIAQFGQLLPRWIANHGPACVALDHVVKDRESRGRYAIGGVHKLNGINGAAFVLENRKPFTVGGTGRSGIYVSKDRPGGVRRHALPGRENLWWFADLAMTSHNDEFVEVSIPPPVEQDENFRPTILMAKIAAALTLHGPLSQRKILAVVKGRNTTAVSALTFLQLDGYVSDKTPHELLKPYLGEGDSGKTDEPLPPVSQRVRETPSEDRFPPPRRGGNGKHTPASPNTPTSGSTPEPVWEQTTLGHRGKP